MLVGLARCSGERAISEPSRWGCTHKTLVVNSSLVTSPPGLVEVLDKWTQEGGRLKSLLRPFQAYTIRRTEEAMAICRALDAVRQGPKKLGVGSLAKLFRQVRDEAVAEGLKKEGTPRLRLWVDDAVTGKHIALGLHEVLNTLAVYAQPENVSCLAAAARSPALADNAVWPFVLARFTAAHPFRSAMIEALRSPLPEGRFMRTAYLELCNQAAIDAALDDHPFNSPAGLAHLEKLLSSNANHGTPHAIAALAFVDVPERERLLGLASEHPSTAVQIEAAKARVEDSDLTGLDTLVKASQDPRFASAARKQLRELGHGDDVPASNSPEFDALSTMSEWLAHSREFGRPPDSLEIFDTRKIFWPPTADQRTVTLLQYCYDDGASGQAVGIGMVGSITFSLVGEATADMSAPELYGLHCAWELSANGDARAPEERSAEAGLAILREHNDEL